MALIQSQSNGSYLSFNEEKHSYTLDGSHVPGVTTMVHGGYVTAESLVSWMKGEAASAAFDAGFDLGKVGVPLNATEKKEIIKAAKNADKKKSKDAAAIGTFVHDFAYYMEKGNVLKTNEITALAKLSPDYDKIDRGINKFIEWKNENKDTMVASEEIVASIQHQYGGKFDRLASRAGVLILSDFKTSNSIYLEQFVQLGAYSLAIREWLGLEVGGLEILRFGKEDGELQTLLVTKPEELKTFEQQAIRCKQTYDFRKMENDKRWKYGGKGKK